MTVIRKDLGDNMIFYHKTDFIPQIYLMLFDIYTLD